MKPLRIAARFACAVLFVSVVALWIRSHFASDMLAWTVHWSPPPAAPAQSESVFEGLFGAVRPDTRTRGIPVNRVVTTTTGRLITYRPSPFG